MARTPICRRIGCYPDHWSFAAQDATPEDPLTMGLDEYECIRLIDREGLTQEQCAKSMGVARTTVTHIYESARRKLAMALVDGKTLLISGGPYTLREQGAEHVTPKGENTMRIAVTYENGEIFQHFGHTEQFKLYDVENGAIVATQIVDSSGSGHGLLAGFLKQAQADALICGGIGMGARAALSEAGIALYPGVRGSADEAAKALAEGRLECDPDYQCNHHGHHHDGACGHHEHPGGCGQDHHCHGN